MMKWRPGPGLDTKPSDIYIFFAERKSLGSVGRDGGVHITPPFCVIVPPICFIYSTKLHITSPKFETKLGGREYFPDASCPPNWN